MAVEAVAWVQLARRISRSLHRELKLHCVTARTSMMAFVTKALEQELARFSGAPGKASSDNGVPLAARNHLTSCFLAGYAPSGRVGTSAPSNGMLSLVRSVRWLPFSPSALPVPPSRHPRRSQR